jgi:hypothetical protein
VALKVMELQIDILGVEIENKEILVDVVEIVIAAQIPVEQLVVDAWGFVEVVTS